MDHQSMQSQLQSQPPNERVAQENVQLKQTIDQLEQQLANAQRQQQQDVRPAGGGLTNSRQQERDQAKTMQEQLLREVEQLKGNQQALSRPGTASAELAEIRAERDRLLIEVKNLKAQIAEQQ